MKKEKAFLKRLKSFKELGAFKKPIYSFANRDHLSKKQNDFYNKTAKADADKYWELKKNLDDHIRKSRKRTAAKKRQYKRRHPL